MAANFDLNSYETVKQRKKRFYTEYPNGRITVDLCSRDSIEDYALFKASVFLSPEEQEKGLARGIGFALELRDKELKKTNSGKQYESVNYTSWTENCEESAVGRALDNAGFFSDPKCSREEMEKAQRMARIPDRSSQGSAGDYVVPFGKAEGKKVSSISKEELDKMLKWCEGKTGAALTLKREIESYLK
jgi:hypothetical protein